MMINKLISLVKFRDVFNKIPFLILLFPILLISYIIIFQGSLSYHEDIIINLNIENVIELHENTSLMKNYMDGFISYDVIKGKSRNTGSIAEITTIFNSNESVSRKIVITEEVILSNLPNQKILIYNSGAVKNIITYRFIKMGDNKTIFFRSHEYEFNTYTKVSSFFMSKKIKRKSYAYLSNFKNYVENY